MVLLLPILRVHTKGLDILTIRVMRLEASCSPPANGQHVKKHPYPVRSVWGRGTGWFTAIALEICICKLDANLQELDPENVDNVPRVMKNTSVVEVLSTS